MDCRRHIRPLKHPFAQISNHFRWMISTRYLCSEELNLAHEITREMSSLQLTPPTTALVASRGRGRGRFNTSRGRPAPLLKSNSNAASSNRGGRSSRPFVACQICGKSGHTAVRCWYRHDPQYSSDPPTSALFSPANATSAAEWYLDSGASSHLTSDPNLLQSSQSYTGTNQVVLGNGQQLPIQTTGNGILPTPAGSEDAAASSSGTLY
ncbi:hypothetical protein MA16_Dca028105 [Dendrobium catenatum]|uniref:Retrovirus-related Pol polyprotein from transposon TNT 1-94-like beta-barrel domain-containing protein n=1 Tax=Dendrobium catenatum TaxID=906689 RepID=A0A2I0V897_9ASPA|nr:hypothetical protein MA16_Dca028105 [Dendrobium catenatum]